MKWIVTVPAGQWMAGPHKFRSKKRAVEFADRWYTVEINSGNKPPLLPVQPDGSRGPRYQYG